MAAAEIKVVDDVGAACAEAIVATARSRPGADIVLSGGSTPAAAYRLVSRSPEALERATLWFGDERCVPPDDDWSNYAMVRETLLDDLDALEVKYTCHRIKGELGPAQAADAYQQLLEAAGDPPAWDLILLGIGPDGHTLSVFPGKPAATETERLVLDVPEAGFEPFVPRVTFTFPALRNAKRALLLASGSGKADAVFEAFGPGATPRPELPASMLPASVPDGALTVLLDADAAARLGS